MKRTKILISAMAFFFAIGAAFVTKSAVVDTQGYIPNVQTGACNTSITCSDSGGTACTSGGNQVYKFGATTCDVAMNRTP